jgi:hypothetical protein
MKTSINWCKRVVRALLAGVVCTILAFFVDVFTVHSSGTLGNIAHSAIAPGVFIEDWIFGPVPREDVYYHPGRRSLVAFIAIALFYTTFILLLSTALRLFSSAKSERRRANSE